jgi:hypothetical protein
MQSVLSQLKELLEQTKMIKLIEAHYLDDFRLALTFSDGREGVFVGQNLLQRSGPLLVPLHDESYFRRVFIDGGALCWPNGLELSPQRLYESCTAVATA